MSYGTGTSGTPGPYPTWQTAVQPVPPPAGVLPSRVPTVLITIFFGFFGAIPAYLHGKRAEELGGSSSPYWKAFGITLAVSVLAWIAIVGTLFVFLASAGTSVSVDEGITTSVQAPPEQPAADDPAEPWTAAAITPVLDDFADDEAGDWAAFSGDTGALIPCGGQWASGAAPDRLETTTGGARYLASAQILPDAASAGRELDRLRNLVAGCGAHDFLMSDGGVVTACDAPVVASLDEIVRYEQTCDIDPTAYAYAIFQTGNAVVAMAAPNVERLDGGLAAVRSALGAD